MTATEVLVALHSITPAPAGPPTGPTVRQLIAAVDACVADSATFHADALASALQQLLQRCARIAGSRWATSPKMLRRACYGSPAVEHAMFPAGTPKTWCHLKQCIIEHHPASPIQSLLHHACQHASLCHQAHTLTHANPHLPCFLLSVPQFPAPTPQPQTSPADGCVRVGGGVQAAPAGAVHALRNAGAGGGPRPGVAAAGGAGGPGGEGRVGRPPAVARLAAGRRQARPRLLPRLPTGSQRSRPSCCPQ